MGVEEGIAFALAMKIRSRIVESTIARLTSMTEYLQSGDDSGLENIWEEICVQVQDEESAQYSSYDDTIERCIAEEVSALDAYEQIALWLCTVQGEEWRCDAPENSKPPICIDDIAADLRSNVLSEAADFENERIYNFRYGLESDDDEEDEDNEDEDSLDEAV